MKKSILIPVAIATIGLTGVSVFAATNTTTSTASTPQHMLEGRGGHGGKMMTELTDAEKTALTTMTTEQKQAFLAQKRAEMEARRTAHETVIDKLLAGQALTAQEETTRQEIIKERAERKTEMTARKAQLEKLKTVLEKQKAGTTLTADEQTLLDSMPHRGEWKGHGLGYKMKSLSNRTQ